MRIKKFHGKSFKEVLETVKQDLGPDAVILSSNSRRDNFSGETLIEITAAIDEKESLSINTLNLERPDGELLKELEKLKVEVNLLRESVSKLFPSLNDKSLSSLYNFLIKNNIEPHLALMLIEKAKDLNELREVIKSEIRISEKSFSEEKGFIFYGLPGVGKTTTVYKMIQALREKNEKTMVLSLDDRISAVAALKEMALRLKCEARIVRDHKELYRIIHKEIGKKKLLIDTPGDGHVSFASDLKGILKDVPIRKCLVVDATISKQTAFSALKSLDSTSIDCIGFSKIDLSSSYGNLYNISVLSGKPVSFLSLGAYGDTSGRLIPPDSIKNLVVGGVCAN